MSEVTIIGIELAKRSFQVHGARSDGSVGYRKKLTRAQLLPFLAEQPRCIVAIEACATAHGWGRQIRQLGHEVKLFPPQLDFVHYEGKQSAYSSRLNKRD